MGDRPPADDVATLSGPVEAEVSRPEPLVLPPRIGSYRVVGLLGRGGEGIVVAARDDRAPATPAVAVKLVRKAMLDSRSLRAFRVEAKVTRALRHPNVVRTLDVGDHAGEPFLVMDLVFGVPLALLLKKLGEARQRLPMALAAWILAEAAAGLHAAHELAEDGRPLGIVHRDVSPHNVMLSFEGGVLIADFGIAKHTAGDATTTGVVKGKFGYMSPEQALGQRLDRRSDVFSFGIMAYEMLTGQRPFSADSPGATIGKILSFDPEPLRSTRPELPEELERLVLGCLEKERQRRVHDAGVARERLVEIAGADPEWGPPTLIEILDRVCAAERRELERLCQAPALPSGDEAASETVSVMGPSPAAPRSRIRSIGAVVAGLAATIAAVLVLVTRRPDAREPVRVAEPPAGTAAAASSAQHAAAPERSADPGDGTPGGGGAAAVTSARPSEPVKSGASSARVPPRAPRARASVAAPPASTRAAVPFTSLHER